MVEKYLLAIFAYFFVFFTIVMLCFYQKRKEHYKQLEIYNHNLQLAKEEVNNAIKTCKRKYILKAEKKISKLNEKDKKNLESSLKKLTNYIVSLSEVKQLILQFHDNPS